MADSKQLDTYNYIPFNTVVVDAWERLPSTVKMYLNYIANEKEDITDKNVDKYFTKEELSKIAELAEKTENLAREGKIDVRLGQEGDRKGQVIDEGKQGRLLNYTDRLTDELISRYSKVNIPGLLPPGKTFKDLTVEERDEFVENPKVQKEARKIKDKEIPFVSPLIDILKAPALYNIKNTLGKFYYGPPNLAGERQITDKYDWHRGKGKGSRGEALRLFFSDPKDRSLMKWIGETVASNVDRSNPPKIDITVPPPYKDGGWNFNPRTGEYLYSDDQRSPSQNVGTPDPGQGGDFSTTEDEGYTSLDIGYRGGGQISQGLDNLYMNKRNEPKEKLYHMMGFQDRQYGGGLDDAYMTLSERRRRSSAFADPDATSAFANGGLPTIYRDVGGGIGDDYALAAAEYEAAHGSTDPGNVDPNEGLYDSTPELAFGAGQYVPPQKGDPAQGNEPLGYTNPLPTPFRSTNPNYLRYEAQQKINRETQGRTPEEIAAGAGNPFEPNMPYFTGPSSIDVQNFIVRQKAEADLAKAYAAKDQAIADIPDPTNPVEVHFAKIGALGREAHKKGDPDAVNYSNSILFEAAKMPGGIKDVLDAAHRGEYGQKAANLEIPQEVLNQISRKAEDVNVAKGLSLESIYRRRSGGGLPMVYRREGGGEFDEYEDESISLTTEELTPAATGPTGEDIDLYTGGWSVANVDKEGNISDEESANLAVIDPATGKAQIQLGGPDLVAGTFREPGIFDRFFGTKTDKRGQIFDKDEDTLIGMDPNYYKKRLNKEGYTQVEYTFLNDLISKGYDINQAENILAQTMATPGGIQGMRDAFYGGYSYGGPAGTLQDLLERGTMKSLGIEDILKKDLERRAEDKYRKSISSEEYPTEQEVSESFLERIGLGGIADKLIEILSIQGEMSPKTVTAIKEILPERAKFTPSGFEGTAMDLTIPLIGKGLASMTDTGKTVGTIEIGDLTFNLNMTKDGGRLSLDTSSINTFDEGNEDIRPIRRKKDTEKTTEDKKETTKKTSTSPSLRKKHIEDIKSYMSYTGKSVSESKKDLNITDVSITEEDFT